MEIKILMDNHAAEGFIAQWGLSVWIQYRGRKILLDTGSSGDFVQNAALMGIDLNEVEFGVLSHAHYDHGDGMEAFFEQNSRAMFYIRQGAGENCYDLKGEEPKYIGLKPGTLSRFKDRICFVDGDYELFPGVRLLPHRTAGLGEKGRKVGMYCWRDGGWQPDSFAHEQSLVLEAEKGLVIFNSCCHAGADTIVREAQAAFPDQPIHAIVGGFHLYQMDPEEVRAFARRLAETGVAHVITGHCTGQAAYDILREELGDKVRQLSAGLVIEV